MVSKLVAGIVLMLMLVGTAVAGPVLNGTWSTVVDGEPLVVVFAAGNNGTVNGAAMRWQLLGSVLLVEQDGEVATYQVQQQGDRLLVTGGDFSSLVTLTRGTGAAAVPRA